MNSIFGRRTSPGVCSPSGFAFAPVVSSMGDFRQQAGASSVALRQAYFTLVVFMVVAISLGSASAASTPQLATVAGRVSLIDADGRVFGAPGVRLTLRCGTARSQSIQISNERGEFRFTHVAVGTCDIVARLQGFGRASARASTRDGEITRLELVLKVEPIYSGLIVTGKPRRTARPMRRDPPVCPGSFNSSLDRENEVER
jgi:hypothetical protein